MTSVPEALPGEFSQPLARARSRLGRLAGPIHFFSTIGSTSDVAAALAAHRECEGTIVVAEAQTGGRGRRGRLWFSPPGAGLYTSVVLMPARSARADQRVTSLLTLAAGVALADAIERAAGLRVDIKWPNDLLSRDRKLAGILAEGGSSSASRIETVILGYGINVRPASYPPELTGKVTSLEAESGRAVDRGVLFAETLAALAERYEDLLAARFDAILDDWRLRAPGSRGASVSWEAHGGRHSGVTAGVDQDGALLVQTEAGMERIVAGEVTWA